MCVITHNQIVCIVMDDVMDFDLILIMKMMTVSIIIWMRYVVQNSYLKA